MVSYNFVPSSAFFAWITSFNYRLGLLDIAELYKKFGYLTFFKDKHFADTAKLLKLAVDLLIGQLENDSIVYTNKQNLRLNFVLRSILF